MTLFVIVFRLVDGCFLQENHTNLPCVSIRNTTFVSPAVGVKGSFITTVMIKKHSMEIFNAQAFSHVMGEENGEGVGKDIIKVSVLSDDRFVYRPHTTRLAITRNNII